MEIAEAASALGKIKTEIGWGKLLVLGFLAGAYIAFGSQLAVTAAAGAPWPEQLPGIQKLVFGAVFPVGLMLVVIAGSELFTGNCLLPTIACLKCKAKWLGLLRNWVASYLGNFIGSVFCAYFLAVATGLFLKSPYMDYITSIAQAKCGLSFTQAFLRGVGCNWLVCLAVWLAIGSEDIVGKIFAIQFPIMAFVALGFEHSVANMFFIPAAIFATAGVTWSAFLLHNLLPVTLGNIVGGAFFVGGIYWWVYLRK
jgi:formate/nitrite transporter